MEKKFFNYIGYVIVFGLCMIVSAQKNPDKGKFYYAFNEKVYIEEIPSKFLIKARDKQKATDLASFAKSSLKNENKIKFQNEQSFTIDLNETNNTIDDLFKNKKSDILLIRHAYKYQKQEMYYADEILVEPKDGISIQDVLAKTGVSSITTIKQNKFYAVLEVQSAFDACDIANTLQESGLVKYSHPNFMMPAIKDQVIPNDTYFNNQYYLRNTGQVFNPVENHFGLPNADINASFAWNTTLGNNNIIVAVIDEGLTPNHPDLPNARQVRLNGSNFVPGENANDPTPGLNNNHGNACSGIIAATQNNNEGVTGIAPNVRIMPIKVFGENANADDNGFAAAIDFAWQHGAHVISNSWGYNTDNPNFVPAIVAAINRATTQGRGGLGCVVSFAAGNTAGHSFGNNGFIHFPANVQTSGVLTVGASDRDDEQADYSPTSDVGSLNNQIIDIVGPSHRAYPPPISNIVGETLEIWTIDIPGANGYNPWNDALYPPPPTVGDILPTVGANNLSYSGRMGGTSAACPQVAAVAALILSINNNLTQQQVFNIITQSAEKVGGYVYNTNGWCPELGNGRLNACAALTRAVSNYSISGPDQVCTFATYIIQGLPAPAAIQWTISNTNIATVSPAGVVTFQSRGIITLTANITVPNRCGAVIVTKTLTIGDAGISSINLSWLTPCYGSSQLVKLDAVPSSAGTNWYWTVNQGQFAFTADRHLPSVKGYVTGYALLTLSYTGTFCGTQLTGGVTAYTNCSYRLSVYPNPSTDVINLTIDNGGDVENENSRELSSDTTTISRTTKTSLISNTKGTTNIYLYDLYSNQLVKKWNYHENSSGTYNLNVAGIKRGIYVLKVERDNTLATIKIILQ